MIHNYLPYNKLVIQVFSMNTVLSYVSVVACAIIDGNFSKNIHF